MTVYSHSRLSTFEQCRLKYKYHYIDKIETDIDQTIECFMGELVHKTLEKLYIDKKFNKKNSLKDLIDYYNRMWKKNFNEKILIVRKDYNEENFRKIGEKCIKHYFEKHRPFEEATTIATEKKIEIDLDDTGNYVLQGYIDRLDCKGNTYEIHDYKTSSHLPLQKYADQDRQLALYSIAVNENYKDAKDIKLIWHYLVFKKDIVSTRSKKEIEKLKKQTINLIEEIESNNEYYPKTSTLCRWCEYQRICPNWKHLYETKNLPKNKFLNEPAVKLANEYVKINNKKKKLEKKLEKLKKAIFDYCYKNDVERIFGTDHRLTCKTYENYKKKKKKDPLRNELIKVLKKLGKYEEASQIDIFKLSRILKQEKWPKEIQKVLLNFTEDETVQRIYVGKKY